MTLFPAELVLLLPGWQLLAITGRKTSTRVMNNNPGIDQCQQESIECLQLTEQLKQDVQAVLELPQPGVDYMCIDLMRFSQVLG